MSIVYLHPLQTCYGRLRRAEEHLEAFNQEMDGWAKSNAYDIIQEPNADRTEYVYRAKVPSGFPPHLSVILSDCLHNLRASLDHLVFQLAGRPTGKKARRVAFPIFDDPAEYASAVDQMLLNVHPKARTRIERLQPYHTRHAAFSFGPPLLLVLYHLSNFDKHRDVHLIWAITKLARVRVEEMPIEQELFGPVFIDGAKLARFKFARPDVKMNISFDYAVSLQVADLNTVVSIVYFRAILDLIRNQILPQFGLDSGLWGHSAVKG